MNRMRLAASGYTEVLHARHPGELDIHYLHAPPPSALADDCREILYHVAAPYVIPSRVRKCGPYLPGTSIGDGIFKVSDFHQRLLDVGYLPCHYGVEAYRVTVFGGRGKADEVVRPRSYVLVKDHVDMERDTPMKTGLKFALELPEPAEHSFLEWIENGEGNEGFPDSGNDLPESVEHRFLLEGKF